jgi:hypothetical protein
MADAFQMGGWGMWPILIFGVVLLGLSARYAVKPEARLMPMIVTSGMLTGLAGVLGCTMGIIRSIQAVAPLPPEKHYLAMVGASESMVDIAFALILMILAGLAVFAGTWRAPRTA